MFSTLSRAVHYLNYYLRAGSAHGVHSPYVYHLITEIIYNNSVYYCYRPVEGLRLSLLNDDTFLKVEDHGAGSKSMKGNQRKISSICRHSVKSSKYAQLIFRLALHQRSKRILELGTSLGLTTLYLSYACPDASITTIEGSDNIAGVADSIFKKMKRRNIELIRSKFKEALPELFGRGENFDLFFIDGHHEEEACIYYFEELIQVASEDALFIIDDINWSKGMRRAWEKIKDRPDVSLTIDLFELGLVYIKPRNQKEHFMVRF